MAYKMSLDYPLAKRFLKAMDNLIDPEIADYSNSVGKQIIMLEQCEIYNECHGEYAKATVEKLDQLYKEWHDLMLQLKNCKNSIANKVEQIHAYDMEEQAKQEQQAKPSSYQPVAGIVAEALARDYRSSVNAVNSAFPKPQTQLYENGGGGNCHIAAMTRLLNRKAYLDGHGTSTYSVESVYTSAGATNVKKVGNYRSGVKYSYNGSTGGKVPSARYTAGSVSYQAHKVSKSALTSASGGTDAYMTSLLNSHPEGVCVRTNGHVAVITDYEIVNGKVQYYVSDSFTNGNGISKSGRIRIEDSSLYNGISKDTKFYNMKGFDYISYLT